MEYDKLRISETDLFGRFFLKKPNGGKYKNYFDTVFVLSALLEAKDWYESVTGYYINVTGNMDAVRLSYFTTDPEMVNKCKENFCSDYNIIEIQLPEYPHAIRISEQYGNEELRFRKFLHMYTQIGLDLIKANL